MAEYRTTAEHWERVRQFLAERGPTHCSEIWQTLGIPKGSIYPALRCETFRQLRDSRWCLTEGPTKTGDIQA